jgi:hypothetical protein
VGGDLNQIGDQSYGAFIGAGTRNKIKAALNGASDNAVLVGGLENVLQSSPASVLSGGYANNLLASSYSFIGGGTLNNLLTNGASVIAGGANNQIETDASWSSIGGGQFNRIGPTARWASIPGGDQNDIGLQADHGVIAGGQHNQILGGGGNGSTIGGGLDNQIGYRDTSSVVAGGSNNTISGESWANTVAGGQFNTINTADVRGLSRTHSATILGGNHNVVAIGATGSCVAGIQGTAQHAGTFVWSDGTAGGIASTRENQVTFQTVGGVRMITGRPATGPMVGAELLPGSGSWSSMSDRNAKTNLAAVDPRDVLARVASLPIGTWNYRSQDETIRHIGPMAQDFREAFGLGEDERHISAVDADGVALAAIQGLNQRLEEQRTEIARKDGQVTDLQKRVAELESVVRQLVATRAGGDR